ncbi:helix-turn-helix domain-containing protein [Terasakiella sp. SH-1]|uniref:helix-turn-helix domain-containing protein n=1 Tax=Terasakiella sp. SH-1 TaxID=2560057 RepID=UPI00107483A4|nr:helix-turn-helix domain-containing protein [Terasakiella sp. SH-1]
MSHILKMLRTEKNWSQEQLAECAGISVRTIQRIENGAACSLETAKCLAAVFEVEASVFLTQEEDDTSNEDQLTLILARQKVKEELKFYYHLVAYIAANAGMIGVNLKTNSDHLWFIYPLLGWGIGLAFHGIKAFSAGCEQKLINKLAEKKLQKEKLAD